MGFNDIHGHFDNHGNFIPERFAMTRDELKDFITRSLAFLKGIAAITPFKLDDTLVAFFEAFGTADWFLDFVVLVMELFKKKDYVGVQAAFENMNVTVKAKLAELPH